MDMQASIPHGTPPSLGPKSAKQRAAEIRWATTPDRPFPAGAVVDACLRHLVVRYTWKKNNKGYYVTRVRGKAISLHRFVWLKTFGTVPKELDHINRNRVDCRISNLRPATRSMNTCGTGRRGRTLPRGVSQRTATLYEARFRCKRLGYFACPIAASAVYEQALSDYIKEQEAKASAEYFAA